MFEGEYLYGQKLSGKFYINGKLEYEGEYLYDKKWNGKGYDENGILVFEGVYLNDKRNWDGKEYNETDNLE